MKLSKALMGLAFIVGVPVYAADPVQGITACLSTAVTTTTSDVTETENTLCKGGVCINRASFPEEAIRDKSAQVPADAFIQFRQESEELLKCTTPKCLEIANAITIPTVNGGR